MSRVVSGGGGVPIVWMRRPGDGLRTIWVHATGFCKEIWDPVFDELTSGGVPWQAVAYDQRSHGPSGVPTGALDPWDLGRDALAVVDAAGGVDVGIGHSSGGAALVMAELLRPGTFRVLLLMEPIIFPDRDPAIAAPFVDKTLRRRRRFASPQQAYDLYRGKEPFSTWDERSLWAYLGGGLRRTAEEWELACRPENEAAFYRAFVRLGVWDRLGEVRAAVDVIVGAASDTYPPGHVDELVARFPDGNLTDLLYDLCHNCPAERFRRR
ncbi:MAG: alpha/beta fold hydrolase, partial [Acidimicrobiia bacterium]